MNRRRMVVGLGWILGLAGCASHPHIALTHREDMAAQSRVVAIAAHNLEDSVSRHRGTSGSRGGEFSRGRREFRARRRDLAG